MRLDKAEHEEFSDYGSLFLDETGRFREVLDDLETFRDAGPVPDDRLMEHFRGRVALPDRTTDVFVFVHGWRTAAPHALARAQLLFGAIANHGKAGAGTRYPSLVPFDPRFLAVCWPSLSSSSPWGYAEVRDRARAMTDEGYAEFFLAYLLGHLSSRGGGQRREGVLRAKDGFYVHVIGHSFGNRFLTAALRAASRPTSPKTHELLASPPKGTRGVLSWRDDEPRLDFTVDTALALQMAAPSKHYVSELQRTRAQGTLSGPMVLTHSRHDRANCLWHRFVEAGEAAIGCRGIQGAPRAKLLPPDRPYNDSDFDAPFLNVDASEVFRDRSSHIEGAHSDVWHEETVHLALSLANWARRL